jgi:hypothetical protein
MEIVVTGSMPFSAEQVRRLQRVGRVTVVGGANSGDEWLEQVEGAEVVVENVEAFASGRPRNVLVKR